MKPAPNQPITTGLVIFGGVYVKAYVVPDAGTLLPQHAHATAHVTAITAGAVCAWVGDETDGTNYEAPALIKIEAMTLHRFLTLTPAVSLLCIHNADHIDADGEPAVSELAHIELED